MFFTSFIIVSTGKECFESSKIANNYISQLRFKTDILSILGSSVMSSFGRFFSLFGLFKAMRVFRIGPMIAKSNVEEQTKATLNLFKLIFYLFFYLHTLACYMWLCVDFNSATRYYREYDNGYYISFDGEILKDENGSNVPIDD